MKRVIEEKTSEELENIVKESLNHVGIIDLSNKEVALVARLIMSGLARYFYLQPDVLIRMGFVEFKKNPDKDELFAVNILRSTEDGVINADTLWRYYTGELSREKTLKGLLDDFVSELLSYSQIQEMNAADVTRKIHARQAIKEHVNKLQKPSNKSKTQKQVKEAKNGI